MPSLVAVPLLFAVFGLGFFLGAFRTHRTGRMPLVRRPERWAIALYTGPSPTDLSPAPHVPCPMLTAADATDMNADFVADPFLFRYDDRWYLFFEILNAVSQRGEIAYASSEDGREWTYEQRVLAEPFHLSYPQVLAWNDAIYLIPESQQAGAVRLYRADPFPHAWTPVATLLHEGLHDPTLFRHDDRWWMLASEWHNTLRLFHADSLDGPWTEHPQSPLIKDDPRYARPAGRVVVDADRLIRFSQDCTAGYGQRVHAFEITHLTPTAYTERLLQHKVVAGTGVGWNAARMHHVDAHPHSDGSWMAVVDGDAGQAVQFDLSAI